VGYPEDENYVFEGDFPSLLYIYLRISA